MARLARLVIPGLPHHVTQRGNGRQRVFFSDADYKLYLSLLAENCEAANVECWAYCLMPTHVHAILVPKDEDGLRAALAPTHRRYASLVNARRKRTGHFWQGRYGCAVLDDDHLDAAFRHILRYPVEARLAERPERWRWSSARAYVKGIGDGLTETSSILRRHPNLKQLLGTGATELDDLTVRDDETIGRPRGSAAFLAKLERKSGRTLAPAKRGPKPRKPRKYKVRGRAGI